MYFALLRSLLAFSLQLSNEKTLLRLSTLQTSNPLVFIDISCPNELPYYSISIILHLLALYYRENIPFFSSINQWILILQNEFIIFYFPYLLICSHSKFSQWRLLP